ncbi:MAG: hypothetical protein ACKOQ6_09060 [Bacteroidota bacterium]
MMIIHRLLLIATFSIQATALAEDNKSRSPEPPSPTVALNFQNAPANELLALYRALIPEELVEDSGIQMGPPVTLQTKSEVSREKAVEMIESTLMLNGYTLLQQAPGIIKVLGPAKFPRSQGTPIYYSLTDLPKGNRVVTYFMSLKNVTPMDAVQLFQAQVSPPNSYTSFMTVTNVNAVLITESTPVIRQLVGMQPSFDVPSKEGRATSGN